MSDRRLLRDASFEQRLLTARLLVMAVLMTLALGLLVWRMVQLQLLQYSEHVAESNENRIQVMPVAPTRGLIYDRNGVLLAENVPVTGLSVVRERVDDLDALLQRLRELIGLSDAEIAAFRERLEARTRPFEPVALRARLTEAEAARVAVERYRLPGVEVEARLLRHYPFGAMLAHAVGSVRRINEADLEHLDPVGYSATRYVGKRGVEKAYERALHGQVGHERVEIDARGRHLRVLDRTPPVAGQNLTLHLDVRLQRAATAALGDRRGAIVAIEPGSGGVLAMVSRPGYDPNLFVDGIEPATYRSLEGDVDQPLFNRATRGRYPPGSTFKPFVGLAGLQYGATDWTRSIYDPGYYRLPGHERIYRDWTWRKGGGGGQGEVALERAIYRSSNTYFYDLGVRLGVEHIADFAGRFGFGRDLSIDVADARSGVLPTRAWKRAQRGEPWYPGDDVNLGIGQGYMLVTPLQLATAVATIANRGERVRPRMLLASDAATGVAAPEPLAPIRLHDQRNWERMIDAMEAVVHRGHKGYGENGTAWAYMGMDAPYRIAGKSGTSQVVGIPQGAAYDDLDLGARQRKHAWFMAFAPADDPRIAVAVLVENGGGGSSVAGPIAREVLDAYLLPRPLARR